MKRGSEGGRKRQADAARRTHTKHGMKNSREYHSWQAMKQRCMNPTAIDYPQYGGKGVTICERWLTFSNFYADMGQRPENTSLDRYPNKSGPYAPNNCRWATEIQQQQRNKTSNTHITFNGETRLLVEWSEELGISLGALAYRFRNKWSVERAFTTPYQYSRWA